MADVSGRARVRVPATTANLGPGFDCLGMALSLHNVVEFEASENSGLRIEISPAGQEGDIPRDKNNLVYKAADVVFNLAGRRPHGLIIRLDIHAPLARGLGSSASAIVGGMSAANALLGNPIPSDRLLLEMARMEGHPDNVVACAVGGLTASLALESEVLYEKYEPSARLAAAVLIPGYELATHKARAALPQRIPVRDAVFNLSRVPLLISALVRGDFDHLADLMEDRLHQPYRKELVREYDVISAEAENAGAAGVFLSGAGPTMIAFADAERAGAVADAMLNVLQPIDPGARSRVLKPDLQGCSVIA